MDKPEQRRTLPNDQIVTMANPLRRLGAAFIDGIVILIPLMALVPPVRDLFDPDADPTVLGGLILAVVGYVYEQVMLTLRGQTVGKMATGIRLVAINTGDVPDGAVVFRKLMIPLVLSILSTTVAATGTAGISIGFLAALVILVGHISLLWHNDRQSWYDRVAKTIVVDARDA